jgi:rubrerythrin
MQEFIARENIRRFEAQLAACTDPEQRKTLTQLLEAEKQQLAEAMNVKRATGTGR